MSVPHIILDRLAKLSAECGVNLRVVKHWKTSFGPDGIAGCVEL